MDPEFEPNIDRFKPNLRTDRELEGLRIGQREMAQARQYDNGGKNRGEQRAIHNSTSAPHRGHGITVMASGQTQ